MFRNLESYQYRPPTCKHNIFEGDFFFRFKHNDCHKIKFSEKIKGYNV